MRRISHDLPGIAQRIAKLRDEFDVEAVHAQQIWKDEKGRQFFQQHVQEVRPTLSQLVAHLTRTIELFENVCKQLRDPRNDEC